MNILEFKNMFNAAKRTASNFDEFCGELELYLEAAKMAEQVGVETPDEAIQYISEQISQGYTSGRADRGDINTSWGLETDSWREEATEDEE